MPYFSKSLHHAAITGNLVKLKFLLWMGVCVNARDSRNRTALHVACQLKGSHMYSVIEVLLRSGAEVNVQDNFGRTPLHKACLKWGRSVHTSDSCSEQTALHTPCQCKVKYQSESEELFVSGAEDNTQYSIEPDLICWALSRGLTLTGMSSELSPLHLACPCKVKEMHNVIEVLLRSGTAVNIQDNNGRTPLHDACSKWGKVINTRDSNEQRAPYLVQQSTDKDSTQDVIDMLLRFGAEVNVQDKKGRTPLHEACERWNQRTVVALLRNGAKIGMVDSEEWTPLHEACYSHHKYQTLKSAVNTLISKGNVALSSKDATSQHSAYHPEDGEVLNVVNVQNCNSDTALQFAGGTTQEEVTFLFLLLHMGAKVGVRNKYGETALHCAAAGGSADAVEFLLDNGEDVNAKDCIGNTPLHLVSRSIGYNSPPGNTAKIIENLLNKGANVYEKNDDLETPYEMLNKCISDIDIDSHEYFQQLEVPSCDEMDKIEETFIKHTIKQRTLTNHVSFDMKWNKGRDNFLNQSYLCRSELKLMASTVIVKDMSLYDVLSHKNHLYLLSIEDLLRVHECLCSPDLLSRFPLYGHTLRTTFQRPKLLTMAVQSFYTEQRKEMVKNIPCEVTEQVLSYLTNEDLRNFVKSE